MVKSYAKKHHRLSDYLQDLRVKAHRERLQRLPQWVIDSYDDDVFYERWSRRRFELRRFMKRIAIFFLIIGILCALTFLSNSSPTNIPLP